MRKYDALQENPCDWNDKIRPVYLFFRERRPAHGFSTDQMDVQMLYGLSPVFPGVDDKTESAFLYSQLFRNLRSFAQHITYQSRFQRSSLWAQGPQLHNMLSYTVMFDALQAHELQPAKLLCPWDSPGKNTGVGCHFLPQGIFRTQGSNLPLLLWQADSLSLSHLGSS